VAFSWSEGDVKSGQYLWTNKKAKTVAFAQSKWLRNRVEFVFAEGFNRRVGYIDMSDIDQNFSSKPTGLNYTRVINAMGARAEAWLWQQNMTNITRIELKENNSRYTYRQDYNVGDIVAVNGNYDTNTVMRVTEFVEIQDENGYSGYPTLEPLRQP
jgi:hypothetical protein